MNAVLHQLAIVFGYPAGIVTGNLLAEVLVLIGAIVFRDRLGRALVVWHHKHHMAHMTRLGLDPDRSTPQDSKGPTVDSGAV